MTRRRMSQCHICLLAAFLLCTGRSAAQQCKSSSFQTQCVGNGLWVSAAGDNQSLGQCTPRQCRDIPTIHGGDIRPRVNSVPVGSSLRVVCNRGFELRGPGSPSPSCLVCGFRDCPICTKQKALRASLVSMLPAVSLRASTSISSKKVWTVLTTPCTEQLLHGEASAVFQGHVRAPRGPAWYGAAAEHHPRLRARGHRRMQLRLPGILSVRAPRHRGVMPDQLLPALQLGWAALQRRRPVRRNNVRGVRGRARGAARAALQRPGRVRARLGDGDCASAQRLRRGVRRLPRTHVQPRIRAEERGTGRCGHAPAQPRAAHLRRWLCLRGRGHVCSRLVCGPGSLCLGRRRFAPERGWPRQCAH